MQNQLGKKKQVQAYNDKYMIFNNIYPALKGIL